MGGSSHRTRPSRILIITEAQNSSTTSCDFWLIPLNSKNLRHFPPIIRPRQGKPHLAREVCRGFYSPSIIFFWSKGYIVILFKHNFYSLIISMARAPLLARAENFLRSEFFMVLRYSHDIISIVSQFPRRITPFGLKNFPGGPSVDQVNGWSTFVGASWWALTAEEPTIPPSLFPALDKFPSFVSLPFCTLGALTALLWPPLSRPQWAWGPKGICWRAVLRIELSTQ